MYTCCVLFIHEIVFKKLSRGVSSVISDVYTCVVKRNEAVFSFFFSPPGITGQKLLRISVVVTE